MLLLPMMIVIMMMVMVAMAIATVMVMHTFKKRGMLGIYLRQFFGFSAKF